LDNIRFHNNYNLGRKRQMKLRKGQTLITCKQCGKTFLTTKHKMRIFCSMECVNKNKKLSMIGNTNKPKVFRKTICNVCGKETPLDCLRLNNGKCFMCNLKDEKLQREKALG
jgi:hypothetical protein